jgi:hypothetical protein
MTFNPWFRDSDIPRGANQPIRATPDCRLQRRGTFDVEGFSSLGGGRRSVPQLSKAASNRDKPVYKTCVIPGLAIGY